MYFLRVRWEVRYIRFINFFHKSTIDRMSNLSQIGQPLVNSQCMREDKCLGNERKPLERAVMSLRIYGWSSILSKHFLSMLLIPKRDHRTHSTHTHIKSFCGNGAKFSACLDECNYFRYLRRVFFRYCIVLIHHILFVVMKYSILPFHDLPLRTVSCFTLFFSIILTKPDGTPENVLHSLNAGTWNSAWHFVQRYMLLFFFDFFMYKEVHCGQTLRKRVPSIIPAPSPYVGFSQAIPAPSLLNHRTARHIQLFWHIFIGFAILKKPLEFVFIVNYPFITEWQILVISVFLDSGDRDTKTVCNHTKDPLRNNIGNA